MTENLYQKTYCANHPNRETMLRCNRCNKLICTECAVLTETGYRCKECVRGQQKVFETAQWYDYPLALAAAVLLAFLGSYIARFLGFFTLFIAPVAGVLIAEAVRWLTRRRRSAWLYRSATFAAAAGGLIFPLISVLSLLLGSGFAIITLVFQLAYALLMTSSFYYRLTGIQIRR